MWVVTTTDGREYVYDTFEAAYWAGRELFGSNGYTIMNTETDFKVKSKRSDKK